MVRIAIQMRIGINMSIIVLIFLMFSSSLFHFVIRLSRMIICKAWSLISRPNWISFESNDIDSQWRYRDFLKLNKVEKNFAIIPIWRRQINWENISSESTIIKRIICWDREWILYIYIYIYIYLFIFLFFNFLKILKSAQSVKA